MTLSTAGKIRLGSNRVYNSMLQKISIKTQRTFNKPTDITFDITTKCCLRCRMCDIWQTTGNGRSELTFEQWRNILYDLHDWLGPFYAQFSGGEPFMKDGFLELVKISHELGNYNKVVTNAFLLDEKLCDDVLSSDLDSVNISLDSLKAEVHDYVRNVKGAYKRAVSALEYLSENRDSMRLSISTIMLKQNLDELVDIVEWAQVKELDTVVFQPLEENFETKSHKKDWKERSEFWIDDLHKLDSVLDKLIQLKQTGAPIWNSVGQLNAIRDYCHNPEIMRYNFVCPVGYKNFSINAFGKVKFCFLMKPVGDYFDYDSARDLWKSKAAENSRKAISACNKKCLLNCHQSQPLLEKLKGIMLKK